MKLSIRYVGRLITYSFVLYIIVHLSIAWINRSGESHKILPGHRRISAGTSRSYEIHNGSSVAGDQKHSTQGQHKHGVANDNKRPTVLDDVYISVKTGFKNHGSRVRLILDTWYPLASNQTYFITDGNDKNLTKELGDHLIKTLCSTGHCMYCLICKYTAEFDAYIRSGKRWFCHVDDDQYVNVPLLLKLLKNYNHLEDWYIGKPSIPKPKVVVDREDGKKKVKFRFATGGAGICISHSLAQKMIPYISDGKFWKISIRIGQPDDVALGFLIEVLLNVNLTIIPEFHSHIENLTLIKQDMLKTQITFGYDRWRRVNVTGLSLSEDPSRLRSLHCYLFPRAEGCQEIVKLQSKPTKLPPVEAKNLPKAIT